MGILISIVSCHKFRERADALRRTWVPRVPEGITVKFFVGGGEAERPDEIVLDCPDDYPSFRLKVQRMFAWAVAHGFQHIFKTDDDVYVIPDKLIKSMPRFHYAGRVRAPSGENDAPRIYGPTESNFCSGFGYWLSRDAANLVAQAPDNGDWAEDRFTGNALFRHGIRPWNDPTVMLWPPLYGHFCHAPNPSCTACRQQYATASVICPYARPDVIEKLDRSWLEIGFIPTNIPEE
jgi:Galactosyltransferase